MRNDTILLQKQIMDNSKSINEYFKDLFDWEKDISKRDQIVKCESTKNPIQINKNFVSETENIKEKEENKNSDLNKKDNSEKTEKLKRDTTMMKDYYAAWDKFKVDSEEEGSESEKEKAIKSKSNFKNK